MPTKNEKIKVAVVKRG